MKICLDAGHGGRDPGAYYLIKESDMNLIIVNMLKNRLKDYELILTREYNNYVDLEERCKIANDNNCDLFLSIHCNASDNPKASGIETLVYSDVEDKLFQLVHSNLIKDTEARNRGIITRPNLYVLKNTNMKSMLIEVGFLSNNVERNKLKDEAYRIKIANSIANSIKEYYGTDTSKE